MDARKLRNLARILRAEGVTSYSDGTISLTFAPRFEAVEPVQVERAARAAPVKMETPEERRTRELEELRAQLFA